MNVRPRSIACALLVALMLPLPYARASSISQKIEAAKQKSQALQSQLHQKRGELNTIRARESELRDELDRTNQSISAVNVRIDDLAAQSASTQRRLTWNTTQLRAAQRSLERHNDALKRRLVDIYENGDMSYLSVLMSAQSFTQFVERWEDLRLLIAANERAIRERKAAQAHVANIEQSLEATQVALDAQQQAQAQARTQLSALADERQNLVAVADQQRQQKAVQVAQLEDLTAAEEAELEDLVRQRQAELEAQLEAQRRAQGIAGPPPATGGALSWPVSGTITSPFGWRSNPFGGAPEFHAGLDIAAPTGTTVSAAASGTVLMAQWYGGYGNYILLDHGGGVSTGYGHLSAIYVAVGQTITRGQAIGAVGSTGQSTGPHLHFEVRVNGKPVDPAQRLH